MSASPFSNPTGPVVAYTFDRNYAPYAVVSMASVQAHCAAPIQFYCLVPKDDQGQFTVFDQLLNRGFRIKFVEIDMSYFAGWPASGRFPLSTYARLLLPKLLDEQVIVYLDPDTVAYRDIEPIFKIPLGSNLIAAALDIAPDYHAVSKIMSDSYSNAGVMIMNLQAFDKNYLDDVGGIMRRYGEQLTAFDQCIINLYTDGRKLHLESCWNQLFIGDQLLISDWKSKLIDPETKIAHYAASPKPWSDWAHPQVRAHWNELVRGYGLSGIPDVPIGTTLHLEQLAHLHDINAEYRQASAVKTILIQQLKNKLRSAIA